MGSYQKQRHYLSPVTKAGSAPLAWDQFFRQFSATLLKLGLEPVPGLLGWNRLPLLLAELGNPPKSDQ
jgi:hypothetical protein